MAKKKIKMEFTRILRNGKEIPTAYDVDVDDQGKANKNKEKAQKGVIDRYPEDDIRFTSIEEDEKGGKK